MALDNDNSKLDNEKNELVIVEHILFDVLGFNNKFIEQKIPTINDQNRAIKYLETIYNDINKEIDIWYDNYSNVSTYIRTLFTHSSDKEIFIEFLINLEFVPTEKDGTSGETIEKYYVRRYDKDNKIKYELLKLDADIFKRIMLHLITYNSVAGNYVINELC